jgi:hypothetical protein
VRRGRRGSRWTSVEVIVTAAAKFALGRIAVAANASAQKAAVPTTSVRTPAASVTAGIETP